MATEPATLPSLNEVQEQTELAQACAFLAVIIAAAVLISNLGPTPNALVSAREQVLIHEKIRREHQKILRQNEAVLSQNQAALAVIRARPLSPK